MCRHSSRRHCLIGTGRGIRWPDMANVQGLRDHVRDWAERTMKDALDRTYQDTVRAAPVASGYLVTTIDVTQPLEGGAGTWVAEISVGAPYSGYTDAGTS